MNKVRLRNIILIVILVIVVIFIVSAEMVRHQGKVILPVGEFYSTALAPLSLYTLWCQLYTKGKNVPFPPIKEHFPRHQLLKNNWITIRNEALKLYKEGETTQIKNDLFFNRIADDGWKKFYICWYGPIAKEAWKLCPKTCELIQQLPEIKLAMFSILEPGSKIKRHVGPFKAAKRYHLGLHCPKGAEIIVDGIKYQWENGEDVLLDDTFVHEVVNNSDQPRIILFCDVVNTMISSSSQKFNEMICNKFGPITSRANSKKEKVDCIKR